MFMLSRKHLNYIETYCLVFFHRSSMACRSSACEDSVGYDYLSTSKNIHMLIFFAKIGVMCE